MDEQSRAVKREGNDGPRVNQAGFAVVQQHKVVAIVAAERLDEVIAALADAGIDLTRVDVLEGAAGADILDYEGTGHGFWAHLARTAQKLGTASNERENFSAALRAGEAVVMVPARQQIGVDAYGRILAEHGGRRIIHFARYTTDLISY